VSGAGHFRVDLHGQDEQFCPGLGLGGLLVVLSHFTSSIRAASLPRGQPNFVFPSGTPFVFPRFTKIENEEVNMGFGRGALLWLLGIPLPIIILLALFWHH
jgi:hypothetical protein